MKKRIVAIVGDSRTRPRLCMRYRMKGRAPSDRIVVSGNIELSEVEHRIQDRGPAGGARRDGRRPGEKGQVVRAARPGPARGAAGTRVRRRPCVAKRNWRRR